MKLFLSCLETEKKFEIKQDHQFRLIGKTETFYWWSRLFSTNWWRMSAHLVPIMITTVLLLLLRQCYCCWCVAWHWQTVEKPPFTILTSHALWQVGALHSGPIFHSKICLPLPTDSCWYRCGLLQIDEFTLQPLDAHTHTRTQLTRETCHLKNLQFSLIV